jgi:tetratricopeptide (TPR) repeat protein
MLQRTMNLIQTESLPPIDAADQEELSTLSTLVQLNDRALTIFAITPDAAPNHPVVQQVRSQLGELPEAFQFETFFYSDNSFYHFLYSLDGAEPQPEESPLPEQMGRRVVFAFGLEQLDTPRLVREMQQLNLGREVIFARRLIVIFWLNKASFLDEFRRRAPDFWDWRGKVLTFQTRPPDNPLLYPYLEWLIAENSYLKMSGIMQVNRQVDLFLDQIYVSLQAERRQQVTTPSQRGEQWRVSTSRRISRSPMEPGDELGAFYDDLMAEDEIAWETETVQVSSKTVTERVDLASVAQNHTYSVILGAPGAGKTTLLRYLALHYAKAKRDGLERVVGGSQEDLGAVRLPILIRIADYAERLDTEPDLSLHSYVQQFYRQWEAAFEAAEIPAVRTTFPALLLNQMHQGNCLILLDGLDEVFDQESRRQVVQGIDAFVAKFAGGESGNRFVVTSRIAGYRDVQLSARFQEFTIAEMAEAQVEEFLRRWCRAIEEAQQPEAGEAQWVRQAEAEVDDILKAVRSSEGVKRLTVNPLLLTILALIHRNGSRLPERRVELYQLAVKTLTEDWQLGKKLPDAPKLVLKEQEAMELLAPLAYWMHEEKPSGMVTQAEATAQLAKTLAELNGVEPASPEIQQAVDLFLRKVRETTGLFVERAPDVYGFMHLTFEEYFAARHIANNDRPEILQLIRDHLYDPRWEEPILLALGYCSHTPKLIERLVNDLFRDLEAYQPRLTDSAIAVKRAGSPEAVLVWTAADQSPREFPLMALMFAGRVLAEVDVSTGLRQRLQEKLAITYLLLDTDFDDDTTKAELRLLRRMDGFNGKSEVADYFKQVAQDATLARKVQVRAQVAVLYLCSSAAGNGLRDCVIDLANQFDPDLFNGMRELVTALGEDLSSSLEATCQDWAGNGEQQAILRFFVALSYMRPKHYEQAIPQFEQIAGSTDHPLHAYVAWCLAVCHQEQKKYETANDYYQTCFEQLTPLIEPNAFLLYWCNRGVCQRLHERWEQALDCFQHMLTIARELNNPEEEASALYHLGRTYQEWKKFAEAIAHHEQSRDRYQQLDKETNVANQWYWMAVCYREWGKYELALEAEQQDLAIREKLDDSSNIADAYNQLGRIYQAWGKYAEAIAHHEQSRDRYQKLDKQTNVANQWDWIASCYREWGKYELALDAEQQNLAIRQKLDDLSGIANACFHLGRIYQTWGKYAEAIAHHEQSRDRYQQLDKETNVANQWYWMAVCYREWGKYELALEAEQQDLAIREKLDDSSNIADAYNQLGRIYQAWGKYAEAIAHHEQSRDRYQQLDKETNVANQWYWMAVCYREWGKYELALEAAQQDLAIREKLDESSNIASAYYQLGRIYQAWGKYAEAIAHYQQSRDRYQQLDKETDVANQWYWIGDCYKEQGKYEQAIECQQRCLELRNLEEDQSRVALSIYQLGRIYQAWGKYAEAIAHYQQSRDRYQQLDKETNVANQWSWMAECYREWGKYELALEAAQQDLAIREKLDESSNIASAYYQLGRIYQAWGKYAEAIAHYQQSRDRYQQLDKETDVANQWYWIGDCYKEQGKYEQAIECQQRCLELRNLEEDQSRVALSIYQLGRIYQAWGKYAEAIAHYQQSRDRYQQLDKETNVANQWSWMAECYREWGKYELALEAAQQDLAIREKLDESSNIALDYYQLGRIYQAWGKYAEAIAHHEQSRDLYETLDLQEKVANQLSWLAGCYCELKDYATAIDYYQASFEKHQALGNDEAAARRLRQLSNTQRRMVSTAQISDFLEKSEISIAAHAIALLQQAEQHLQQALQLDTAGDYRENLAHDQISLALLAAEYLRWLGGLQESGVRSQESGEGTLLDMPGLDSDRDRHIAQFEQGYAAGFARFTELGQESDLAEAALDIARAYLEIPALQDRARAEAIARQSLQTFQTFHRHKLEADACKLLEDITHWETNLAP